MRIGLPSCRLLRSAACAAQQRLRAETGMYPCASLTFCLGPARIKSVVLSFCTACEYPSRVGTPGRASQLSLDHPTECWSRRNAQTAVVASRGQYVGLSCLIATNTAIDAKGDVNEPSVVPGRSLHRRVQARRLLSLVACFNNSVFTSRRSVCRLPTRPAPSGVGRAAGGAGQPAGRA